LNPGHGRLPLGVLVPHFNSSAKQKQASQY